MSCVHHWAIETPTGAICNAVCRLCGAERTYPATLEREYNVQSPKQRLHEAVFTVISPLRGRPRI